MSRLAQTGFGEDNSFKNIVLETFLRSLGSVPIGNMVGNQTIDAGA